MIDITGFYYIWLMRHIIRQARHELALANCYSAAATMQRLPFHVPLFIAIYCWPPRHRFDDFIEDRHAELP